MSKSPAFQMYAGDYLVDTIDWELDELGLYTRLLMVEWANGPLPDDPKRLAKIAGTSLKKFNYLFELVRHKFIKTEDDKWINERLENTRQEQDKYRELQRIKGLKSAEKRATTVATTVEPQSQPEGQPEGNPPSPPPSPPLNNKRKNTKVFSSDSSEYGLSELLLLLIQERDPKAQANLQTWASHIDKLIRIDQRTQPEIEKVLRWSQADPFWQNNILSTVTLREKFQALTLKMEGTNGTNRTEYKKPYGTREEGQSGGKYAGLGEELACD